MSRLRLARNALKDVNALERFSLDALAQQIETFGFGGLSYAAMGGQVQTTYGKQTAEPIGNDFTSYAQAAYKQDGIVFACILARILLFSEVRFQFQRTIPRPGDLFGTAELQILETPWPGATTGDLLARIQQSDCLAGNAYTYRNRKLNRLKVLRPDWVNVIIGSYNPDPDAPADPHGLDSELLGYSYTPGGNGSGNKPILLMPEEVSHYAPIPDPEAMYRGMSWLTAVLPEVRADKQATAHKLKFFENGATPNMVVKYPKEITAEQLGEYVKLLEQGNTGTRNAYKTLHIGGGADPMVVGASLKDLDYRAVQGAGETRIAAASGIPSIIIGLSEGLDASTYSNFHQARRLVSDKWLRPSWRQVAGSLAQIIDVPGDSRLWYDASDVSFLQEDEKDAADILARDAQTIRTLVDAGYDPESVVAAVKAANFDLLVHSGLYSVQLQKPGSPQASASTASA